MKRRDLVRKLRELGFVPLPSKGPHEAFSNGVKRIPVPRHKEIGEGLAVKILRDAGA